MQQPNWGEGQQGQGQGQQEGNPAQSDLLSSILGPYFTNPGAGLPLNFANLAATPPQLQAGAAPAAFIPPGLALPSTAGFNPFPVQHPSWAAPNPGLQGSYGVGSFLPVSSASTGVPCNPSPGPPHQAFTPALAPPPASMSSATAGVPYNPAPQTALAASLPSGTAFPASVSPSKQERSAPPSSGGGPSGGGPQEKSRYEGTALKCTLRIEVQGSRKRCRKLS